MVGRMVLASNKNPKRKFLLIGVLLVAIILTASNIYYNRNYINPVVGMVPSLGISKLESDVKRISDFNELRSSYLKTLGNYIKLKAQYTHERMISAYLNVLLGLLLFIVLVGVLRSNK